MTKDIVEKLPFWERVSPEQKTLVSERSSLRTFEANQVIANTDNTCTGIVFIERGGYSCQPSLGRRQRGYLIPTQ